MKEDAMIVLKTLFLIVVFIMFSIMSQLPFCYAKETVCYRNKTLECLEKNFDQLYASNPQLWSEILERA